MKQYTPEFRRDAVALVRSSGRPMAQIARELGVDDATLGGNGLGSVLEARRAPA
ncbi:MAG: transposase [Actinomycetota bacterium]